MCRVENLNAINVIMLSQCLLLLLSHLAQIARVTILGKTYQEKAMHQATHTLTKKYKKDKQIFAMIVKT